MTDERTCIGAGGEPLPESFPREYPASAMQAGAGRCPVCGTVLQLDEDALMPAHPPRATMFDLR
jgi:hypothetical protein